MCDMFAPRQRQFVLHLDSRDRDKTAYPSPSDYKLPLHRTYREVSEVRLLSAELPASVCAFSSAQGNTSMDVRVTASAADLVGRQQTVSIPDGNYDRDSMAAALEAAMQAAFGHEFTASIDAASGVLDIASSVPEEQVLVQPGAKTSGGGLAGALGFTQSASKGDRPVELEPLPFLLLALDAQLNQMDTSAASGAQMFAKLLLRAREARGGVVCVDRDAVISSEGPLPQPLGRLDRMTVSWRTRSGAAVDFRGREHSFTLLVRAEHV